MKKFYLNVIGLWQDGLPTLLTNHINEITKEHWLDGLSTTDYHKLRQKKGDKLKDGWGSEIWKFKDNDDNDDHGSGVDEGGAAVLMALTSSYL